MTRPTIPNVCDICAKTITEETQYTMEVYQGTRTFADEIIKAKKNIDCCHKCFVGICKNGYKPLWQKQQKNPNYIAGSKQPNEKYWLIGDLEETK